MIRTPDPSRLPQARPAFTLIEMIVALAVFAIMASMIVPRLVGNDKREFKLAVERVGDLLTMYAQREELSQKVVGIGHDARNNWIELATIDTDNSAPDQAPTWKQDYYVKPVRLPRFMRATDVEFTVDGNRVDASQWYISNEVGHERPLIEITLRGADEAATLTLYPHAVGPVLSSTYGVSGVIREPVDLDTSGRSREDW